MGETAPQPAPGPVLRLMQIRRVFKKLGGRVGRCSKELMCVGAQSRTAVSTVHVVSVNDLSLPRRAQPQTVAPTP